MRRSVHVPTYQSWMNLRSRCGNPKATQARWYADRGITVCDRWDDYLMFLEDMGERPGGMSIDRVDPAKGYSKENCRWATHVTQCNNRSSNHRITFAGRTLSIAEWARETGISQYTISQRLRKLGWSESRALTEPTHGAKNV